MRWQLSAQVWVSLGILALGMICVVMFFFYSFRRPLPQTQGAVYLTGLTDDVSIYRDEWGVPQIYAATTEDLFFAQGYLHAQDRWWQMEMSRHMGMGRLSELLGEDEDIQAYDRLIRALGWEQLAYDQWLTADPWVKTVLRAYTDGVNGYLATRSPTELAVEYTLLGSTGRDYDIQPWLPHHTLVWILAYNWQMSGGFTNELLYNRLLADSSAGVYPLWADSIRAMLSSLDPLLVGSPTYTNPLHHRLPPMGNAWVVNGTLTDTGQPLLANDLQGAAWIPSQWYEMGLHCINVSSDCPYNLVGMSLAGIPTVIIGHNTHLAWGLTPAEGSTHRLSTVTRQHEDSLYYATPNGWRMLAIRSTSLKINSASAQVAHAYLTEQGAVLTDVSQPTDQFLVLEWANPNSTAFLGGLLQVATAQSWSEYQTALSQWDGIPTDFFYMDQWGNIGQVRVGQTIDQMILPSPIYNPPEGWLMSIPADDPRALRLTELHQTFQPHNVDTFTLMQQDTISYFAAKLLPILLQLDFSAPEDAVLLDYQTWLAEWDSTYAVDSPYPVFFNLIWHEIVKRVFDDNLGIETGGLAAERTAIFTLLSQPDHPWWDDLTTAEVLENQPMILRLAFEAAIQQAEDQNQIRAEWLWGDWQQVNLEAYLLGRSDIPSITDLLNRDALPIGGDLDSLSQVGWQITPDVPFRLVSAPAFRVIFDSSDWDQSRSILSSGQSGHPASSHYEDMLDVWSNVAYRDMLWQFENVYQQQESVLRLRPRPVEVD